MHRQRVETLLAHMKMVTPHKFSICSFVSPMGCKLPEDLLNDDNYTTACGAGYMPLVFPEYLNWRENCPAPYLIENSSGYCTEDVSTFLDISLKQHDFLFSHHTERTNPQYGVGVEGMIKRLEHILKEV